jgi:hypothetical protein
MDGFDQSANVKVIMATNRAGTCLFVCLPACLLACLVRQPHQPLPLFFRLPLFARLLCSFVSHLPTPTDTLDPALLRPGRLDRKIEFPHPDRRNKRLIFNVCTAKMNLHEEVQHSIT